jgi:hypothetical protein
LRRRSLVIGVPRYSFDDTGWDVGDERAAGLQ